MFLLKSHLCWPQYLCPLSLSQVIAEPNLKVLYTADERYTLKRSFYSKKISTSNSAVHPSQYLTITVDAEAKRQLEQQMKVRETHLMTHLEGQPTPFSWPETLKEI